MLKKLLEEARHNLSHFFEEIDVEKFEKLADLCLASQGLLFFTGVGKSGFIAEKIAATLTSTGTKALFLSPTNFLHGDIGILSENDLVFMLSKSGASEELLHLVPFIRKRGAKIIGVVSKSEGRLAQQADLTLYLPVDKELCEFNLVPTTSAQAQLIFGDVLSIALMKMRKFNLDQYAMNHPAGTIGKKMTLKVKDVMISGGGVPLCHVEQKLSEVLFELSHKKCGALIVLNRDNKLSGIFTDGDLRRALQSHGSEVLEKPMHELMTPSAVSVMTDMLAWDAMKEMQKNPSKWVSVTPVVEKDQVVGILRMHDIIQSGIV